MNFVSARVIDPMHLELAEPISAHRGDRVVLLLSQYPEEDADREAWLSSSAESLGRAYGEIDPDYSLDLVRQANPGYAG